MIPRGLVDGAATLAQEATPRTSPGPGLPDRYLLPHDARFPEGIAIQATTGDLFVSSVADGTIYRGNVDRPDLQPFLVGGGDGRTTAAGLAVDADGRLFVAGGATGSVFVYEASSGALLTKLAAAANVTDAAPTFVNDLALLPSGEAYLTDSFRPVLYRVAPDDRGELAVEPWLDLAAAGVVYGDGFNLNGIVASGDGRFLIAVQSNTGMLFRIDIADKAIEEIALVGGVVTNGDGLVLDGSTLRVVRNRDDLIATIALSPDFERGTVIGSQTDPSFRFPTTAARTEGRLLVVNSQFDRRGGPAAPADAAPPTTPFTVTAVQVP